MIVMCRVAWMTQRKEQKAQSTMDTGRLACLLAQKANGIALLQTGSASYRPQAVKTAQQTSAKLLAPYGQQVLKHA